MDMEWLVEIITGYNQMLLHWTHDAGDIKNTLPDRGRHLKSLGKSPIATSFADSTFGPVY